MALSQKALQRKREKKKKQRSITVKNASAPIKLDYSQWPIFECWISDSVWNVGLGPVIVSRKNNDGFIAVALYLADTLCLGVKDCFVRVGNELEYQFLLNGYRARAGNLEAVDPSDAATFIHQLVLFAKEIGFNPHVDFCTAKNMLKNIPLDETQSFIFGQEGEPLYIQGPYESLADVKKIINKLDSQSI